MPEPIRFQKLSEFELADHRFLEPGDSCYYLGEYIADGLGYQHGGWNQSIKNLQHSPRSDSQLIYYKNRAINEIVEIMLSAGKRLDGYTWIPVPPSKCKDNPEYDDRLIQILRKLNARYPGDIEIRDPIFQPADLADSNIGEPRQPPEYYIENWDLAPEFVSEESDKQIIVFDDVLTRGAHFKAIQRLINQVFPGRAVVGVFITRTTHPSVNWDDLDF